MAIDKRIKKDIEKVINTLKSKFKNTLSAIILYGSWVKGRAREYSDIDLLVIHKTGRKNSVRKVNKQIAKINSKRNISIVHTSVREFEKETIPLYTAAKTEGKIIYGKANLSINPQPPKIKYRNFFKHSADFEKRKVETAQYLLKKGLTSGIIDSCCIASKHAIQAGLAMKNAGFHSKFCILIKLAEEHFGKDLANGFKILFELYVKSEYKMQNLTKRENILAIKIAKKILTKIYTTC